MIIANLLSISSGRISMITLRRNIELIEFPVAEIGFLKSLQTLVHNNNFVQQDIISELLSKSLLQNLSVNRIIYCIILATR